MMGSKQPGVRSEAGTLGARLALVIDQKWAPRRYYVLAVGAGLFAWVWLNLSGAGGGDWHYFMHAVPSFRTEPASGDVFASGDILTPVMMVVLYPFTFLSISTGWLLCSVLCMAMGLVAIWCIEQAAAISGVGSEQVRARVVLLGGPFLMYAWALPGARWGHADDVLALTLIAVAARAVASGRWVVTALSIAVAIDAKPWAGLVVPLVAACPGRRTRGLVLTLVVAGLPWVPFFFAQHGHLGSLNLPVVRDSDLRLLGVAVGATPGWVRPLQVAVALPLGAYAVARSRWYLVPAVALAVRINLDPVTVPYYVTGVVFGFFLWDVVKPSRIWGGRTAIGCVVLALVPSYLWGLNGYGAALPFVVATRLAVAVLPLIALFGSHDRSSVTSDPSQRRLVLSRPAYPRRTRRPRTGSWEPPTSA